MTKKSDCTLSINVCLADLPFLPLIVTHLVKSCDFPFLEKQLVIDTAPLHKRYKNQCATDVDMFMNEAKKLIDSAIIDSVHQVDYQKKISGPILRKHFGKNIKQTHNYRGAPIYPYLYAMEIARGDYFVHFDGDMILHQNADYNWIRSGIKLLQETPVVLSVSPLPGPPHQEKKLNQPNTNYTYDPRGFYSFETFSSRVFLLQKTKYNSILPLEILFRNERFRFKSLLKRNRSLERWELMVGKRMASSGYIRADLSSPAAWSLHPTDHGEEFLDLLPSILKRVEKGIFPPGQAGNYDLKIDLWKENLNPVEHSIV
jgi:hypothetical protein